MYIYIYIYIIHIYIYIYIHVHILPQDLADRLRHVVLGQALAALEVVAAERPPAAQAEVDEPPHDLCHVLCARRVPPLQVVRFGHLAADGILVEARDGGLLVGLHGPEEEGNPQYRPVLRRAGHHDLLGLELLLPVGAQWVGRVRLVVGRLGAVEDIVRAEVQEPRVGCATGVIDVCIYIYIYM